MGYVLKDFQSNDIVGLGTYTYTVSTAGVYKVKTMSTEVPTSSLAISIAQTGSTSSSVSSTAPTDQQNHIELRGYFNCAVNDVITIVISSSAAIDNQLNTVRTLATIDRIS